MTLQFQRGTTPSRHIEPQSVTCRSLSSTIVKATTAEIVTSLTVDGAPVVGVTSVVADTETVQVLDTTGALAGSVTTLQAALDALVLAAGSADIAVVSITAGQTLTLSADVSFAQVQRLYRRVVVRGAGRDVEFTDTVDTVEDSDAGPAADGDGWMLPIMTTAMVDSAHAGQLALNTTTGHYFAVKSNTTTALLLCAPSIQYDSAYILVYDVNDPQRAAVVALDEIVVFMPTSGIACGTSIGIAQMSGGLVEFEELEFTLTDGCNLHSNSRLYFRGCSIIRDAVNDSGNNNSVGPISAVTTLDGCVSSNDANDSGLLSGDTINNPAAGHYLVLKSLISGGQLLGSDANTFVRELGCFECNCLRSFVY